MDKPDETQVTRSAVPAPLPEGMRWRCDPWHRPVEPTPEMEVLAAALVGDHAPDVVALIAEIEGA